MSTFFDKINFFSKRTPESRRIIGGLRCKRQLHRIHISRNINHSKALASHNNCQENFTGILPGHFSTEALTINNYYYLKVPNPMQPLVRNRPLVLCYLKSLTGNTRLAVQTLAKTPCDSLRIQHYNHLDDLTTGNDRIH